jgi:hypothetical protein
MRLAAVMILAECNSKQYSEFTVTRATTLSGQLLDPQGAAVANLQLILRCGASTVQLRTGLAGNYDFGVLQSGICKIRTPSKVWKPPEVKCDEHGCVLEKLRLAPMSVV